MQAIEKGGHKVSTSELTQSRANAVKSLPVQLGVPDSILTARGLGSDFEGHLDEVENEQWQEFRTAQNRFVSVKVQDTCSM